MYLCEHFRPSIPVEETIMRSYRLCGLWMILIAAWLSTSGCRYLSNRYYDMRDTMNLGAGVTAENPVTGVVPPSLGLYLEVTDLLHLGAITFNGYAAEVDMRGSYVGPESSTRLGFLGWQRLRKNQDYDNAIYMNVFKDKTFPWCHRLESLGLKNNGAPAKRLHYEHWAQHDFKGSWMRHRGWHYWEYVGFEVALCDPLLTHWGIMARAGFDLSEVSDFILGWFFVDFKRDDMTADEYMMKTEGRSALGMDLVPARSRVERLPTNEN